MSINYGGPKPKMTKSIGGSMVCMVACAYVDIHNINNICHVMLHDLLLVIIDLFHVKKMDVLLSTQ
jgi:hypothetical protein